MSDTKPTFDLSALEADYTILGELNGPSDARSYIAKRKDTDTAAKRRDDDTNVLITVVTTPKGDEGNALSHLAPIPRSSPASPIAGSFRCLTAAGSATRPLPSSRSA